jgi:beta-galactosidase/beta-glucuronidase
VAEVRGYPRPQLRRSKWVNLNGDWQFAFDRHANCTGPNQVVFDRTIRVPFAPETPLSGIGDTSFYKCVWYRRTFERPDLKPGEGLALHFGAVDYDATVWVNGHLAVHHEGGYTPFWALINDLLTPSGEQEIIVRAEDDPTDLAKPRGKQDWLLEAHSIWYPRTTGIWQTVWLEKLPSSYISKITWTPNLERWEIGMEVQTAGAPREDLKLSVRLSIGNLLLAKDTYEIIHGEVIRKIGLSDPGVDDYRNELLWSPPSPTLISAKLELYGSRGEILDRVASYTALRAIATQGDRIVLNGRVYCLRMVLDQGYWPGSGLTAPDDAALRKDVELVRAMGFNGVRKHQKIEDPRYLYWADRLGLLVWEEMPSAYRFIKKSVARVTKEWIEAIDRDLSHPCIISWVPINESWGVPNLPEIASQRNYVQALYHLTKTLDSTRPVIGNDGWESVATDIIGIHDYEDKLKKLSKRYKGDERIPHLFKRERPGGRLLTVEGHEQKGQPIMLTEFGGIAFSEDITTTWGYSRASSSEEFLGLYSKLMRLVRSFDMLAGFCYTQFADTYQEVNGLLYADRTPKVPIEEIAIASRGLRSPRDEQIENEWRMRMAKFKRDTNVKAPDAIEDE